MTKTSKKILISILLFLAICLLHNSNVLATSDKEQAFNDFANYKYDSTYYLCVGDTMYVEPWNAAYKLKPKITIKNTEIAEVDLYTFCDWIRAKKIGTTKVTITATYKEKTSTKTFNLTVVGSYEERDFKNFVKYTPDSTYNLYLGERIVVPSIWMYSCKPKITIKDTNIAKVVKEEEYNRNYVVAKKVGSTKVSVSATYGGKTETKTFKINVKKTSLSTKLNSSTNDVVSIATYSKDKTQVLLANGELWNTDSTTFKLTSKAAGNVAKHVYSDVYFYEGKNTDSIVTIVSTLKKDNTLTVESSKGTIKAKNVVDLSSYGCLTKSGNYCGIVYENDKLTFKKKISGVDKLFGNYFVRKSGKLYTVDELKISNEKVADACGNCYGGLLLNTKGVLYKFSLKYGTDKYETTKIATKVESIIDQNTYKTKSGTIKYAEDVSSKGCLKAIYLSDNDLTLRTNNKAYLNGTPILTNVADITYALGTQYNSALIIRKDGSIWRLDLGGKATLTKIRSGKDSYKKITTPTKVKATKLSTKKVKVSWKAVEGARKYTIYRATSKNGSYKKIATTKSTSYKDTTVSKGKKYYYKIVANGPIDLYNSYKSSAAKVSL